MPSPAVLLAFAVAPRRAIFSIVAVAMLSTALPAMAAPVPGYVPPVTQQYAPDYVDDTRGVYIPSHPQQRMKREDELANWQLDAENGRPFYAQKKPNGEYYEEALNTVSSGVANTNRELDRIAGDPGLLAGGSQALDAKLYAEDAPVNHYAMNTADGTTIAGQGMAEVTPAAGPVGGPSRGNDLSKYPSLSSGGMAGAVTNAPSLADGGREIAGAAPQSTGALDMQNSVVRLKEERITVRRALQRMMDQIGGSNWAVVWDLGEQNAGLPDMEISIYAEEPFMNVMNSLLARLQTRSGQPLRVIRYDRTSRLVITDRTGSESRPGAGVGAGGGSSGSDVAITETVLKEAIVSLHYDEVPLVDALENVVNQAGKGQWRLRMYAGTDQVLKPAHVEEPFGVAVERILRVFNLKYEIFPGGKLIVVTAGDSFGFRGANK